VLHLQTLLAQRKENSMNNDTLAPFGDLACTIDMEDLKALPMEQLAGLFQMFHTLADTATALLNAPKFYDEKSGSLNKAGEIMARVQEWLCVCEQACFNVAEASKPLARDDIEWRAWTLLQFKANCADSLDDFEGMIGLCRTIQSIARKPAARCNSISLNSFRQSSSE
jgi:hypothetical protein